uniref:Retrovirus-related Pol polyprotein from transposon opus n=1 Tax=Noccaea caerulescens TaxID=107243 RepID=A0A1J3HXG1_NOCCA
MSTEPNAALHPPTQGMTVNSTSTSALPFIGPINQTDATHGEFEQRPPTPPTRPEGQAELSSEHPGTATLLHALLTRFDDFAKGTDHRFNSLFAAQLASQSRITELQASQASPESRHTPRPLPTQRTLAYDNPTPPTNLIRTNDPRPISYPQHGAEQGGHEAEMERMKDQLYHMSSQIHQATSSAPEIDRVLREAQNIPFTEQVARTVVHHPGKLKISAYEGNTDPRQYLTAFCIAMGRTRFSDEERDAGFCQLFVENLSGSALTWFSRLRANSIDSYHQLTTAFLKQYSMYIRQGTSCADLWALTQGPKESLRSFIDRFKNVASRLTATTVETLPALIKGLWYESAFRYDLKLNEPRNLEDALCRANIFIEMEEEKIVLAKIHTPIKAPPIKEKTREDYYEPRQHYDKGYQHNEKRQTNCYVGNDRSSGNDRPNGSDRPSKSSQPWNKYVRKDDPRPNQPFCEFHKKPGHATAQCRHLQEYLLGKFTRGEIGEPSPSSNAREIGYHNAEDRRERQPAENENRETTLRGPDPQKRSHEESNSRSTPPPPPRRRINMIMGGLPTCNDSVRSIKEYGRKTITSQQWTQNIGSDLNDPSSIVFRESDTHGLHTPHNDPLVIELMIGDCDVSRILIDTGSTVDLIFEETLRKMELQGYRIKPNKKPLTGFSGETTMTVGTIKLPVRVGRVTKIVKFAVVDKPAIYNAIMGTPWLHAMQATPSTYHQCLKFPTPDGPVTVRGNQEMSRICFVAEHKLRHSSHACVITRSAATICAELPSQSEPPRELVVQENIDPSDPTRCVGIGTEISADLRGELLIFLHQNASTFAWSTEDMVGINPAIANHELNVDPTYKPIKQKRRKLGQDRAKAVNEEVERLSKAGSIVEVRYPEWLANPVVVKKKSGKWRVCVDFTDLNKACPKDSYPLPHIDRLVEATAGNELLSFMDAFSGYNQIQMHPDDREKTAFITDRGTYCYRVMPFGLKNAGATYQRLVNKMFADQLGQTMEVYIDDMLVKSRHAEEHIGHLRTCFGSLNEHGMKLNPTKCTFAVTSGEFLGYIVTKRGIEANPHKIKAVLDLPSPKNTREVQRLTGRIAALNRFISRSTDKCLPFYQLLRGNKRFEWDAQCEDAFQELKLYLSTPPVLSQPEQGETLYLYISVSRSAVSSVLVREDRGEQKPIFYISKTLDDTETRYPTLEKLALSVVTSARKLRPYFQSHSVIVLTNLPLRTILHSPTQSGRLAKWAVELSEYDIEYRNRTCAKSQVLANFLIELPPEMLPADPSTPKNWCLHADGSSSRNGSGIGIRLESPTGEILEQSFRLAFSASNNEAEYEALLAGLRLAKAMGAENIQAYCDSQLVANQYSGEYTAKSDRMDAYLTLVRQLANEFETFALTKIPRSDNSSADALAALASTSDPDLKRVIPVESINRPSIALDLYDSTMTIVALEPGIDDAEEVNEPIDAEQVLRPED